MGIRERRARNDDKLPSKPDFKKQPRDASRGARGSARGRGSSRGASRGGARGGARGGRGGRGRGGGARGRGGRDRPGRAFQEPEVKDGKCPKCSHEFELKTLFRTS